MSDSDSDPEEEIGAPELVLETFTTTRPKTNPRLEHFKNIIRQNQGKNKIPLPDLEFYQEQILSQIPREEITRKKVREFVKKSKWKKVRGNDHEIFNHITGHEGNDYEHLEDFLIDDFKHFSLAYNDLRLNRKKFLNFHQVLFALLKKNGFNPNEDEAESPTTSDEDFIVSDSEMEEVGQEDVVEDQIELLFESFVILQEEHKILKKELQKQSCLLFEIHQELKEKSPQRSEEK